MVSSPVTGTIEAAEYGGSWPWGHACILCVHDVESPLAPHYAQSLAEYFARPQSSGGPGTSAHAIAGPDGLFQMVPYTNMSWNCGPRGNPLTEALEQCGYAEFTAAMWNTPDGLKQQERVAQWLAWRSEQTGIPLRWATDDDIRRAYNTGEKVGCCIHWDITHAIGATNHWDTGSNFPRAQVMARAIEIRSGKARFMAALTDAQQTDLYGDVQVMRKYLEHHEAGEALRLIHDYAQGARDDARDAKTGVTAVVGAVNELMTAVSALTQACNGILAGQTQIIDKLTAIAGSGTPTPVKGNHHA